MKTVYDVYHIYDVDGGFGDAITRESKLGTFESEDDANALVEGFSKTRIYDKPYCVLECGTLEVRKSVIQEKGCDINEIGKNFNEYLKDRFFWNDWKYKWED